MPIGIGAAILIVGGAQIIGGIVTEKRKQDAVAESEAEYAESSLGKGETKLQKSDVKRIEELREKRRLGKYGYTQAQRDTRAALDAQGIEAITSGESDTVQRSYMAAPGRGGYTQKAMSALADKKMQMRGLAGAQTDQASQAKATSDYSADTAEEQALRTLHSQAATADLASRRGVAVSISGNTGQAIQQAGVTGGSMWSSYYAGAGTQQQAAPAPAPAEPATAYQDPR
jgi:hypothetical protein